MAAAAAEPADPGQLLQPPPALPRAGQAPPPALAIAPWWRAAATGLAPATLWRRHLIFSVLMLAALVLRVVALLAFRPAMLIADSYQYMLDAAPFTLGRLRPSGYPMLLWIASPLHSLQAITIAQHLLGLGIAVVMYRLLRNRGLPGWGAALAAVPVLFDARQIALESYILPDTLFGFVIVAVVALLLTRRKPGVWPCALAGLGIAYESVLRGNGLPLILPVLACLLARKVGWRPLLATVLAFAAPVALYAAAFDATYGSLNITNSDGLFLWARTMSFARCSQIRPPGTMARLCPQLQGVRPHVAPAAYLWSPQSWWMHMPEPGITAANNKLAMRFALDAIKTQPAGYARVVGKDLIRAFSDNRAPRLLDDLAFTARPAIPAPSPRYAAYLRDYAGRAGNQHAVRPYATILLGYQRYLYLPGTAFLAVLVTGLAGLIRNRRRLGGAAALPWTAAVIMIVTPVLLSEYLYRYVIVAVPLACLAAGLAFVPGQEPVSLSNSSTRR
jgi:hypothetical protein